jgi:hypothetical protein
MMQPDQRTAEEGLAFEMDPLVCAAMVSVLHNIAGRLVDRQLKCSSAIFVHRPARKTMTEGLYKFSRLVKLRQITVDLNLSPRNRVL